MWRRMIAKKFSVLMTGPFARSVQQFLLRRRLEVFMFSTVVDFGRRFFPWIVVYLTLLHHMFIGVPLKINILVSCVVSNQEMSEK